MNIRDYVQYDGLGLAELVRKQEASTAEILDAALAAIAAFNPALNAVIETFEPPIGGDAAPGAPFLGVPFLLKDVGASVNGVRHESGSRLGAGVISDHDSALARRIHAAGLRIIGRAASPEMAFNITTENRLHGLTRNPWNVAHSAGGSSGGAAAAVAAGMVPIAEANDGGGSIRIPAACCSLVGLKPSRGRISSAPDAGEYLNGLSCSHVVSRSLRDSAAMLDATAGAEPGDPSPLARSVRPYLEEMAQDPKPLRIAVATRPWNEAATAPECAQAAKAAATLCAELGHQVEEARPELGVSWDAFVEANARIWCANIAPWVESLSAATGRPISPNFLEATTLACHAYGRALSASDLLAALAVGNTVSRAVGAFFARFDVLITPTLPQPPHRLGIYNADEAGLSALDWTHKLFAGTPFTPLCNVTGAPAISLPLAISADNLPIGVQFIADLGREDTLFQLAGQIERAAPWHHRRPTFPFSLSQPSVV